MGQSLVLQGRAFRRRDVERLRDLIPVDQYIAMLDHAACTGQLPIIDPQTRRPRRDKDGEMETMPVATKEQLGIIKDLVALRMPKLKGEDADDAGADDAKIVEAIETQSTEQLQRLVHGETKDAIWEEV